MYVIYFLNEMFLLFSRVITINSKSTIHKWIVVIYKSIVYRKVSALITGLASLCHRTELYAHFCWMTFSAGPCLKVQTLFPFLVKWILTSMVSSPVSHPEIQFYGTDSRIAAFPALKHCRVLGGRMAEDGGSHNCSSSSALRSIFTATEAPSPPHSQGMNIWCSAALWLLRLTLK